MMPKASSKRGVGMWIQKVAGGGVSHLTFAPDGRTLYTSDSSGWITAWDTASHAKQRLFQFNLTERCNTRGLFIVEGYLIAGTLGYARVWDVTANALIANMPNNLSFGRLRPASSGPELLFISSDRSGLDNYDLSTGQHSRVRQAPPELGGNLVWFDVSPSGEDIVWINSERRVVLTRADGLSVPLMPKVSQHSNICFSPDGNSLVWMDYNHLQTWDLATLSVRLESVPCFSPFSIFAFHPTAPVFAAMNHQRQLTLFSLQSGEVIRSLDFALGRYVQCVSFAPDGLTCAVGGSNKRFAVFDVDV